MKSKKIIYLLFAAYLLLISTPTLYANWPMFQFDPQHTGKNIADPINIKYPLSLSWQYNTQSDAFSYSTNIFKVVAIDSYGNKSTKELRLVYKK